MRKKSRKRLLLDVAILAGSMVAALYIVETGVVHTLLSHFGSDTKYVAGFIAGVFFTSVFTAVPAGVVFAELAVENSLLWVALIGGTGAVVGDWLIFLFVRDRVTEDIRYLLGRSNWIRLKHVFHTSLGHRILTLFGALLIASPLPDSIGLMILGLSKMRTPKFLLLSFFLHTLGIWSILYFAS